MKETKIILVTGFLGSGKTTVVNYLLHALINQNQTNQQPVTAGVIVNEFGQVSIDAPWLKQKGYRITELNNGSIFCQCLSHTFVSCLAESVELDLDFLLVEGSGLSDPANMETLIDQLKTQTNHPFSYLGAICVVDAKYISRLSQSLETINRQILAASLIVINKADLVDAEQLKRVQSTIRKRNPLARTLTVSHGQVNPDQLAQLRRSRLARNLPSLNTPSSRPATYLMQINDVIDEERLLQFVRQLQGDVARIKGLVRLKDGSVRVDVIGQEISLDPVSFSPEQSQIVIIEKPEQDHSQIIKQLAAQLFGQDATFI